MKGKQKELIVSTGTLVAGAIGATLIYNKTSNMLTNPKLRAAAPVAVGLFLMTQKNKMLQGVGSGMVAVGGQKLVGSFVPALAGFDADEVIEGIYDDGIEGFNDTLNGGDDVLNGYVDEEQNMNGLEGDY